ncbi:MAG: hypothetical protein AB1646_21415 [Thermodesulfobacteriota bacterium]
MGMTVKRRQTGKARGRQAVTVEERQLSAAEDSATPAAGEEQHAEGQVTDSEGADQQTVEGAAAPQKGTRKKPGTRRGKKNTS